MSIHKVVLNQHRALEDRRLVDLAREQGKHVVDVLLDLAVAEGLDTEFQVTTRPLEEDAKLTALVQSGEAPVISSRKALQETTLLARSWATSSAVKPAVARIAWVCCPGSSGAGPCRTAPVLLK